MRIHCHKAWDRWRWRIDVRIPSISDGGDGDCSYLHHTRPTLDLLSFSFNTLVGSGMWQDTWLILVGGHVCCCQPRNTEIRHKGGCPLFSLSRVGCMKPSEIMFFKGKFRRFSPIFVGNENTCSRVWTIFRLCLRGCLFGHGKVRRGKFYGKFITKKADRKCSRFRFLLVKMERNRFRTVIIFPR